MSANQITHAKYTAAQDAAMEQFRRNTGSDVWMTACWRIVDGRIHVDRTSWRFPMSEVRAAIQELEKLLAEFAPKEPEPLPVVDLPPATSPDNGDVSLPKGGNNGAV